MEEPKTNKSKAPDPQISTSFPNDNDKHIDYVVVYKKIANATSEKDFEKEKYRQLFFQQIEKESIEFMELSDSDFYENGSKLVFVLLHCPLKRLLVEAEAIGLEMKLISVKTITNLI